MFERDFSFGPNLEIGYSRSETEELVGLETPEQLTEKGAVSNEAIAQKLKVQGLTFTGKRETLSGGFFGPLHVLEATDANGSIVKIIEKVFSSRRSEDSKRFSIYVDKSETFEAAALDVRPRLAEVDLETGDLKNVLVDWIYNEERALKDLQGISGIPKSYGAVYEGAKGSILVEYIDGPDLVFYGSKLKNQEQINNIYDRFRDTYIQAAKRGYIYNCPAASTVMIDVSHEQPYLIDWYNHAAGDIEVEGPAREKYLRGLEEIETARAMWLEEFRESKKQQALEEGA